MDEARVLEGLRRGADGLELARLSAETRADLRDAPDVASVAVTSGGGRVTVFDLACSCGSVLHAGNRRQAQVAAVWHLRTAHDGVGRIRGW